MVKGAKKRGGRGRRGTAAARDAATKAGQLLDTAKARKRRISLKALDAPVMKPLEYEITSDRRVTLGLGKATAYIDLPIFPGEREVSEGHVQTLFDEMQRGHFNSSNVVLASAELDGAIYKVNGQHTCWGIVYMQDAVPEFAIENVREVRYRVTSREQLKALYSSFDRAMVRTDAHITKVVLVDSPAIAGLPPSIVQLLTPGMRFWLAENHHERRRYTPAIVAGLVLKKYPKLFMQVGKFYQNYYSPHIKRQAIVAALFATYDKVPSVADSFWVPVSNGLDLGTKSDPRYRLREFLQNAAISGGNHGPTGSKRVVDSETMYRIAVLCWNKWRAGSAMGAVPRPTKDRVKPK